MDYLLLGIISVATLLFLLIALLLILLLKNKNILKPEEQSSQRRCPTCGQILEGDWMRCPFCTDSTEQAKIYNTDKTIPDILPIGYLIVKTGADRGKIYRIDKAQINIGSGNQNDIIIEDNNVSSQHAKILYTDKKFIINDLHSQEGTKVNNRLIEQIDLYDNDVIEISNNFFIFKILD